MNRKILYGIIVMLLVIGSCSKKSTPTKEPAIDGHEVFLKNCARCHGATADKEGKAPKLVESKKDKGALVAIITKGKDHMPSFEDKLSTKEIDAAAAWVLSVRAK